MLWEFWGDWKNCDDDYFINFCFFVLWKFWGDWKNCDDNYFINFYFFCIHKYFWRWIFVTMKLEKVSIKSLKRPAEKIWIGLFEIWAFQCRISNSGRLFLCLSMITSLNVLIFSAKLKQYLFVIVEQITNLLKEMEQVCAQKDNCLVAFKNIC